MALLTIAMRVLPLSTTAQHWFSHMATTLPVSKHNDDKKKLTEHLTISTVESQNSTDLSEVS